MILNKSIPLKKHCNYQIGGIADYFYEFKSGEDLKEALSEYKKIDPELKSIFILGRGTNVLFNDEGFKGLVLVNKMDNIERDDLIVSVSSGALMEELVMFATQNSLSGIEWAGGLPGTVGGAIRGNAGAFKGETKDNITEVTSLDPHNLEVIVRDNAQCKFGYRQSIFKSEERKHEIILSAKFKFKKGEANKIKDDTQEKIDYRIDRHPLNYPNIGSIFKNVSVEKVPLEVLKKFEKNIKQDPFPVLPVAKLIVSLNLIGKRIGDAQISTKHPNFIVNLGNAKATDVLGLIDLVKREVKENYNISLEEEIKIV